MTLTYFLSVSAPAGRDIIGTDAPAIGGSADGVGFGGSSFASTALIGFSLGDSGKRSASMLARRYWA